jgi:hypothetical protein
MLSSPIDGMNQMLLKKVLYPGLEFFLEDVLKPGLVFQMTWSMLSSPTRA